MAATTLSAPTEIDNTRLLFGISNLVAKYGEAALPAMLELLERTKDDANYLPSADDFKAIISRKQAA